MKIVATDSLKWLDLTRVVFAVGALVYAFTIGGAAFVLAAAFGVAVVRLVPLPTIHDAAFVTAMILVGWGEAFGVYNLFDAYDEIVHVLVPFLVAPVIYLVLARLDVLPDPARETTLHHRVGIVIVTFTLGLSAAALWEIFELSADRLAETSFVPSTRDILVDLIAGAVGALAAGALLVVWAARRWSSKRR